MGRRGRATRPSSTRSPNFREWTDRSRRNLGVDTLDLVQLHCPPTAVFVDDEVFDALDTLVDEGAIAAYGVSVETCDEALTAIARPGVASVQIILNAFRLKPLDAVLPAARGCRRRHHRAGPAGAADCSPGGTPHETTFAANDHRTYNRHGEAFDVGETFSGVDFATGVEAAQEFAAIAPSFVTGTTGSATNGGADGEPSTSQLALAWIVRQPGVSTVIPGARSVDQADANAAAGSIVLDDGVDAAVRDLYDRDFRATVHSRW